MKPHEHKFDPALETLWEQGVKLHSFLRQGRVGDSATLSRDQAARFDQSLRRHWGRDLLNGATSADLHPQGDKAGGN